jgi:hypothetical protein
MTLVSLAIRLEWNAWLILAIIQVQALFFAPTSSITTAIIFSRLRDSKTEFGPVRAMATLGWMSGCWLISALNADATVRAGYSASALWLVLAAYTFLLPEVAPPKSLERLTLRQRLGWDALTLLRDRDHRGVFIAAALFFIPISAVYPFVPTQLLELGLKHPSAWMTLGQVTEVVGMFALAGLLTRWRLKWLISTGLAIAIGRYGLFALNSRVPVLAGVSLHGFSLVLVVITAQIYIDERVDPGWRVRAQALLYLLTSGLGSLLGFLGSGWWFSLSTSSGHIQWQMFWGGLAAVMAAVLVYFLIAYHGKGAGFKRAPS